MIYLVSANRELFDNESYKIIGVDESLSLLEPLRIVGIDTETSGLNCHKDKLLSLQLGCFDFQIVIDCQTVNIGNYKSYLESDRLFLGWNLKFDIKWLFANNIIIRNVYDGFLMEKLLWNGYPQILKPETWDRIKCNRYDFISPKKKGEESYYMLYMNLKKAGEMYLGVELDKSIRGQIIYKGLVGDVIEYAANDVKYLEKIREKQLEELSKKDLLRAIEYENRFVIPLAYFEYCGVKIDRNKWSIKMKHDNERLESIKKELDKWLIENEPDSKYIKIERQGDLFNGFNLDPIVTINWNSAKQVIPIFKKHGVNVTVEDKEKGGNKDSINAKVLAPQKDKCTLVPLYIKYNEARKVTSTYGENFLKQLDENDRLYTNYNQCGADTFRLSSGGKDKLNKIEYINMQNLPADEETRACFICEKGNKFISADYSGEESVLMASIANDKAMIHALMEGEKDLHTLTAKIVFPEIPKDMPAKEVKEKFHSLRSKAKGYEFLINYMGNANTMMQNFGITEEEANKIYNAYMKGFNGLKRYQDFRRKDWVDKGYILINPVTGHKAFIYDYSALMEDKKWMNSLDWNYYREMKKEDPSCYTVQRVKNYFKRKADTDKQSGNYPIQGTGAIIFRVAATYFWYEILNHNWFNIVKMCIPVHDEFDVEAPKEIAEEVAEILHKCMVDAGSFFSTRCKLDADVSRLKDSSLPDYWVH